MELDRNTAALLGLTTFTGDPCPICNGTTREVRRGICPPCTIAKARAYRRANPEPRESKRIRSAIWKAENPDKVRAERQRHKARYAERDAAKRQAAAMARERKRAADAEARRIKVAGERCARMVAKSAKAKADAAEAVERRRQRDREKQRRRRAIMRGARGIAGARSHAAIKALQRGACAYCGATADLHLDHKHPISKGGQHEWRNLQWLCGPHNMSKRATPDVEFRALLGIPALTPWDASMGLLLIAAEP